MSVYVDPQQRKYLEDRDREQRSLAALNHGRSSFGAWKAAQDAHSASVRAADGQARLLGCHGSSGIKVGRPDAKNGGL